MTEQTNAQRLAEIRRATNQLLSMRGQWDSIAHHMEADGEFRNATTPENVLFLLQQLEARDQEIERLTGQVVTLDRAYGEALLKAGGLTEATTRWEALKAWLLVRDYAERPDLDAPAMAMANSTLGEMYRLERGA